MGVDAPLFLCYNNSVEANGLDIVHLELNFMKQQKYQSLTVAHAGHKDDRKKITEFSDKQFTLLEDGLLKPFTREVLHRRCESAYPGQPWEQEKIVVNLETGQQNVSTYGANAADFGYQAHKRRNPNSCVVFKDGKYTI